MRYMSELRRINLKKFANHDLKSSVLYGLLLSDGMRYFQIMIIDGVSESPPGSTILSDNNNRWHSSSCSLDFTLHYILPCALEPIVGDHLDCKPFSIGYSLHSLTCFDRLALAFSAFTAAKAKEGIFVFSERFCILHI
jgi:hypothetical protein